MTNFLNSHHLRVAGREPLVPFRVQINHAERLSELVCTKVLRVLPEKRLVCEGDWNGRQVVVKFFLDTRNAGRHCDREHKGTTALIKAGIKTPELVFKGTLFPDNAPVLGFQRIIHAQNLAEAWQQAKHEDHRLSLLNKAVAAIAAQHEAGIRQEDLHPGNFLIAGDDLFTIDGDAVDIRFIGVPLAPKKSLKNIGLFFAQFHPQFDKLAPFAFRKYMKKRNWSKGDKLISHLLKEIHDNRNRRKKEYLKKIYRECTAFVCTKSWNQYMVCDRDFFKKSFTDLLLNPDDHIDSGKLLKSGNSATVSLIELDGQLFVVKRYNIKGFLHGLTRCIRPTRAWVSWCNAHRLSFILNIPTPKPIMLIEKRWGPLRSTAYFITEYIEGTNILDLIYSGDTDQSTIKKIVALTGNLFQLLSDASLSHGDFKATNFIFSGDKLFILDLDSMTEHHFRNRFQRAFRRDIKRFMQNWNEVPKIYKSFSDQIGKLKF